jgi:hypothetical protein
VLKDTFVALAATLSLLLPAGRSRGQEKEVEAVTPLLTKFPHRAVAGPVTVYSDIGTRFSEEHAKHAEKVWTYFAKVFAKTPGDKTVLYYTRNFGLYELVARHTPWPKATKGARNVTALWNGDHRLWFIIPNGERDFATQIHEMSHDFLFATFRPSAEYPWIKEGTGMYWEQGQINKGGELVVDRPSGWNREEFCRQVQKRELIPLRDLVTMPQAQFFAQPPGKTYGQSMMLIFYLMKRHPKVTQDIIGRMNKGEFTTNDQLLEALQAGLKMDLETLEKRYSDFALEPRPGRC